MKGIAMHYESEDIIDLMGADSEKLHEAIDRMNRHAEVACRPTALMARDERDYIMHESERETE